VGGYAWRGDGDGGGSAPGPDVVPRRITGSVQRLLDRLSDTPVAVYDATSTLFAANAPFDALMARRRRFTAWRGTRCGAPSSGPPTGWSIRRRN
jgi:hypothetical protein